MLDRLQETLEPLSAERSRDLLDAARARTRLTARSRYARAKSAGWPVLQTALAAAISWLIATRVLGHPDPFFAPVAAIMSLGATRGQRPRPAIEMMLGVALGVGVGDILVHELGRGIIQLGAVVALAMAIAVLVGAGRVLLTEAAISATLVVTVSPSTGGGFPPQRLIDALVGGAVALLFSQVLFPVNPLRMVRDAARSVLTELGETLANVAGALEARDLDAAEDALGRARRANDDWSRFDQALDAGRETARFAPRRRRLRSRVADFRDAGLPIDLMVTDTHVLARGAVRTLMIDDPLPDELVGAIRELSDACKCIIDSQLDDEDGASEVRDLALRATRMASGTLDPSENLSASVLVGYTQATAADILRALGEERDPAHELVGSVAADAQAS
jgi:uncharacterized membrane protein YgaE (UPF0421/DUF939 family)